MKVLVAAACIAILAFVGYFFWGEYSARRALDEARVAAAAREAADREALFTLASADPGEDDMVRGWCKLAEMRLSGIWKGNQTIERAVRNCRVLKYL